MEEENGGEGGAKLRRRRRLWRRRRGKKQEGQKKGRDGGRRGPGGGGVLGERRGMISCDKSEEPNRRFPTMDLPFGAQTVMRTGELKYSVIAAQ